MFLIRDSQWLTESFRMKGRQIGCQQAWLHLYHRDTYSLNSMHKQS